MNVLPWRSVVLASLLLLSPAGAAPAATSTSGQTVYLLGKNALYQRGCFAPCMCPVMEQGLVRGSFVLRPASEDPLFRYYDVLAVSWKVTTAAGEFHVTGAGAYRIGGEFALQQQLTLDLSFDGSAPQHFDSGLVPGGGEFPVIDIAVSINGMYCNDTAFFVRAHPALDVTASAQQLSWTPASPGMSYDVVVGDLGTLHLRRGNFAMATLACMMDADPTSAIEMTGNPAPGSGYWYLIRPSSPGGPGTYDAADMSQPSSRDAGVAASGADCP